jgi:hypothetical protein
MGPMRVGKTVRSSAMFFAFNRPHPRISAAAWLAGGLASDATLLEIPLPLHKK